ncbi:MAG: sugar phosphate isomerase/epimerase [Chloroflexota bacterium]
MPNRLIFSTGSLYLLDTALVFDMAAEAGFDGMEIMCDDRFTTREPGYLCDLSARHGLPVLAVHTPFSPRLPGWGNTDTELGRVRHTVELAEQVGAERIIVHLPFKVGRGSVNLGAFRATVPVIPSPYAPFKRWMESGGLKQLQAETKVEIAVENLPGKRIFGKMRDMAWWNSVEAWSTVHEYLTLDTTHWGTFGIDPIKALHAAGPRVRHIHLSNYLNGQEHRLPQSGELDLAAFLRELTATGFDGTCSVELHPDALAFTDPKVTRRKLRETVEFCRAHLR